MFRFTIRDVLLLMVVVGLVAGWALDRSTLANQRNSFRERAGSAENCFEALKSAVEEVGVEVHGGPPVIGAGITVDISKVQRLLGP